MDNPKPLSWQEGLEAILASVRPGATPQELPIEEVCGLVSAGELRAPLNVPPFANSAMDGYAVVASDTAAASLTSPVELRVIGQVRAGQSFSGRLCPGQAVEIMTGAPLPAGADAVVQVESSRPGRPEHVQVLAAVACGTHVRPAGGDTQKGELLLVEQTRLSPAHIGLLASCAISRLPVYARPSIALLASGDELVAPSRENAAPLAPGQIFDANSPMLLALLRSWGFSPVLVEKLPDERGALERRMREGLACDVLVTTGGVSMGRYDLLRPTLRSLGCEEVFWRLNQQPGGPLLFSRRGSTAVFALPGNPVSCFVCAELYLRPYLLKACAIEPWLPTRLRVRLEEPLHKAHSKTVFVRGRLFRRGQQLCARSTGLQASNIIHSLVQRDGYIVFPCEKTSLEAGQSVEFILMCPEALARLSGEILSDPDRTRLG